jgi:hypothetical protein
VTRFNFEFGCEIDHPLPLFVPWRALLFVPTRSFMELLSALPVLLIHSGRYIASPFPVVKQCLSKVLYVLCTTFHLGYDFPLLDY